MRKLLAALLVLLLVSSIVVTGCPAPAGPPEAPQVKLSRLEVVHFESLAEDYPTGYDPQRVGFFVLAAVFDITNPNDYPIMLDKISATLALEGAPGVWFELSSPVNYDAQWIPAKTTNQTRVEALFTTRVVQLSLLVAQGAKVGELGLSPGDLIQKWWGGIGTFDFPVKVVGSAIFTSPQGDAISSFSEVFP